MGKLLSRNGHPLLLQFINRSCQFQGVPEDDGRDYEIQPLRASLLLRMRTILDAPVPIEKHRACQSITGFSFVQPDLDTSAQFHALQPVNEIALRRSFVITVCRKENVLFCFESR